MHFKGLYHIIGELVLDCMRASYMINITDPHLEPQGSKSNIDLSLDQPLDPPMFFCFGHMINNHGMCVSS